jgi:hypothetical protein
MNEDILLITKEELIEQQFMINKKFVVIDSSLYTPEAFEYIQELVNYAGSILFVSDTKKIYARGKYFGGDIFQADLLYFTSFKLFNELNFSDVYESAGTIEAKQAKSNLNIRGKGHIKLNADYDETTGVNTMSIDYNLTSAVNTERFTIDENAKYNLEVVDGKIKMIKYIPPFVKMSSLPLLEYDSGDQEVHIKLTTGGSKPLIKLDLKTSLGIEYINLEKTTDYDIYGLAPNNTDITFSVFFTDGETSGETLVNQIWGYACIYGSALDEDKPSPESFNNFNKYIITDNPHKTVIIEQNGYEYGWFACPAEFPVIFTDSSTNLQGGWQQIGTFEYYCFNTMYNVYRTEHSGLGNIKWIISKK